MIARRTVVFSVSTLLSVLLAVNYFKPFKVEEKLDFQTPSLADYFIQGVRIKQFDPEGQLKNHITASQLEFFRDDNISVLTKPQIRLEDSEFRPGLVSGQTPLIWDLSAEKGTLHHTDKSVELSGMVKLTQIDLSGQIADSSSMDPTLLQSSLSANQLYLDLTKRLASSHSGVAIRSGSSVTRANQMRVDLLNQMVELEGQVETSGISHEISP